MTSRSTVADLTWVSIDEPRLVVGRELDGVYLGDGDEPSAIDRALRVDLGEPDWEAATVIRPPGYRALSERARAAYVIWLSTGRRAPQAPPVWAMLFLFGLERRILVDGDDDPVLVAEARSLGEVYGQDPEVRRIARALAGPPRATAIPEFDDAAVPHELQVELGRRSLTSQPVDADWARAWAWYHPDVARGAAATRAPDEFARVWTQRFTERHPGGLLVPPRRRRLELGYSPANPSLPPVVELTVGDASDVFLTPRVLRGLRELANDVETDLEAYVRWLGRHPDRSSPATAAGVLPDAALAGSAAADAADLVADYAEEALGRRQSVVIETSTLLGRWADAGGEGSSHRETALSLARILDRYGIGMEPDVRFGGPSIAAGGPAVLFRFGSSPVATPSSAYATAVVTLELCAVVAAADGVFAETEQALLVDQVDRVENLEEAERARLAAHRLLLTTRAVELDDVATRLDAVDTGGRRRLGDYLIEVAKIDGQVTDAERRTVLGVHRLLGLDPEDAATRLADAPVADTLDTPTDRTIHLDERRLRETQRANRDVQDLLGAIFADDEGEAEDELPPSVDDQDVIDGLDAPHSSFLRELVATERATRPELERVARRHGVLPDGAIDVVNEVALDRCDDPVIEVDEDDSVSVDRDVYEGMAA